MQGAPSRILWAWESPQDLRFLEPDVGVAFLAGELHLEGKAARWVPRRNPLRVSPGTYLLAVIRVETHAAELTEEQTETWVNRALGLMLLPEVKGLQVDFDAKDSERHFYVGALKRLRERLPRETPLSMTALASWCMDDGWISRSGLGSVVDEAVPMLFRMGVEEARIRHRLGKGETFKEPLARFSCGISTDEALPRLRRHPRYYVFHPGSWTPQAWNRISRELS
jgi:hypothetical protein